MDDLLFPTALRSVPPAVLSVSKTKKSSSAIRSL